MTIDKNDVMLSIFDMRTINNNESVDGGPSWKNISYDRLYGATRFHMHCAYYSELDTSWNEKNIRTYFNRLYFPTSGTACITVDGTPVPVEKGFIYLIPSGSIIDLHTDDCVRKHWIHFMAETSGGFDLFELLIAPTRIAIADFECTRNQFIALEETMSTPRSGWMNILRTSNLLELLQPFLQAAEEHPEVTTKHSFLPVLQHIKDHLHQSIALDELASIKGWSQEYFIRTFGQAFNISPIQYVLLKRVQLAQRMLCMSSMSTKEIGAQCGFSSPSHFCRAFKKVAGRSPSQFRVTFRKNFPPGQSK